MNMTPASKQPMIAVFLLIISFFLTPQSQAEEKRVGDYIIYYSAFNSTFIQPETAVQYNVKRSKYTGLINVSVHKVIENADDKALKVALRGKATNNLSQFQELGFKEIVEGDAIYYLADFQFRNEESMDLDMTINIPGYNKPISINLSQKFYAD